MRRRRPAAGRFVDRDVCPAPGLMRGVMAGAAEDDAVVDMRRSSGLYRQHVMSFGAFAEPVSFRADVADGPDARPAARAVAILTRESCLCRLAGKFPLAAASHDLLLGKA